MNSDSAPDQPGADDHLLPSREEVLRFIQDSPVPVDKRDIARAFRLKGDARAALKALLRDLEDSGAVARDRGRRLSPPTALPEITVVEVTDLDADGAAIAHPTEWTSPEPAPRIRLAPERRGQPALTPGDRVLARLTRGPGGVYTGSTLKRLDPRATGRILGIYEDSKDGGRLRPIDRRRREDAVVLPADTLDALHGELVLAELLPSTRMGLRRVRVVERLGDSGDPRALSLIAIHGRDIPTSFPPLALEEVRHATPPRLENRVDLRDVPLVTIDGEDARDFDDAVWAEPDAERPGGWHLIVAIADVAAYVRPGSALDRAAFVRGNSCYFPDRVVPMLPEELSNGLCSLKPSEDRACIAAHLWLNARGELVGHRFERALMRSAARLTYTQVQAAFDGVPDDTAGPLLAPVLEPLRGAYQALAEARARRGTLDIDVPERQVVLDPAGHVARIARRARFDSHRLIEEFMICANVAAAEALEARRVPALYRVHDQPSEERLDDLRPVLDGLGYGLPRGTLRATDIARVLARAAGRPEAEFVSDLVLRAQAQAAYAPDNIGHFGLALPRYVHFTSPIRRYADLIVHRGLIRAFGMGDDGMTDQEMERLPAIAEHISVTERRAAEAERDAVDRFTALWLAERAGEVFTGRISGVTRFGLYIRLLDSGADGFVPAATLPDDSYEHDETGHALVGKRSGRVFRLGARVKARLLEAMPLAGSSVFALLEQDGAEPDWAAKRLPSRNNGRRRTKGSRR